ncbi:unnamed protein product [Lymnaea stagnalis]|uniref:Uncharacterized protein n=1 Tax=Lymnaea stagnalis TaxID=6523 RepID=A0AAV2HY72_LYMST
MKQLSCLCAVFALLQILLRTHGLKITLDGFENQNCKQTCRSAFQGYNVTGRIILEEGEIMPGFILYEYKCPKTTGCVTYEGLGEVWEEFITVATKNCDYETYKWGCKLISGRTYRHFFGRSLFFIFRLCTIRARMLVKESSEWLTPVNATGIKHVSNELKMSDYKNDSSYSTQHEAGFERDDAAVPCLYMSTSDAGVDKMYLPGAAMFIVIHQMLY